MGDPTLAKTGLKDYIKNMGFTIMCLLLTIVKLVGKLRCKTGKFKNIFAKMLNSSRTELSRRLDDACWAYQKAYKTPIGMSPYKFVYG